MFVSVYLTCNTGIERTSLQKLSEIGSYVTNAGISFVIAGDWNVLPSELLEPSWPARIKGEILLPCDLEISCTFGRLIDFAVCQRSIVNIAKLQSFVEGPWKNTSSSAVDTSQITKEVLHTVGRHVSHEISAHLIVTRDPPPGPSVLS